MARVGVAIATPVIPLPADIRDAMDLMSGTDADDARWRQWQAKGRADAVRFRGRLRTVLIDVAAVVAVAGALWFAFRI